MKLFAKFTHLEKVTEFPKSIIFRAQRIADQKSVLVKLFKETKAFEQKSILENQIQAIHLYKLPDVPATLELVSDDDNIALVMEEQGGMFLSVLMLDIPFSVQTFLKYAVNITRSLSKIHNKQFIHCDLRPQNILIDETSGKVLFTGLSIQPLKEVSHKIDPIQYTNEDSYYYTSPEQTGRINWQIDQRTDLYSLGIVFYEMLKGQTPFHSIDPLKRIYDHLANDPESLLTSTTNIPEILNRIVMKLLSKSPDDRYQSIFGLLSDLEFCREQYCERQRIIPFELAKKDNIDRLNISSKLYGAQKNTTTLIESFNRICSSSVELMIVKGKAGMGKTSLVQELEEIVQQKNGFFASGRCVKQNKDTPYYSLIKAFQDLVSQILSQDKKSIKLWKEKFLTGFADNGQMLIEFVPEMEEIIGPQPNLPKLELEEAQNRLNYIFRKFLQVFTQDGSPLIIFLDSFHWADPASIQLIQSALCDINSRYLLLVISYQEDLIIHSHTLSITLDEILLSGTYIQEIAVNPLELDDICLLIEDALSFKQNYRSLAQLILKISNGNPYFVKQLLQTYHEKKLLIFDSKLGHWSWDFNKINKADISDNVEILLIDKIKNLPDETIEIMKLASCIGDTFELELLSLAAEKAESAVKEFLIHAIKAGLIRLRGKNNPTGTSLKPPPGTDNQFQFTHGRVIGAVYSMQSEIEKSRNHLTLGRLLQKVSRKDLLDQNTYKIVNQMNQGTALISNQSERHELARLNLIAGKKSKQAVAIDTASKYFSTGIDLLSEESWTEDYDLAKELYFKSCECAYFIEDTEEAEPIFDLLLGHIKTNKERVEVINTKLNLYIKNNRQDLAIETGLEALKNIFHEIVPLNDAELNIVSQMKMQDIQQELEKQKIKNLLYLPTMENVDKIAIMELIANIIPAAYFVKRNLWIFLTLKMVEISLESGNTASSTFGYMNYAVILCSGLQDYDSGYDMGILALDLNAKFNTVELVSQLNFLFGSYVNHWKKKAKNNLKYLKKSYRAGVKYGDFLSAGNSIDFLLKTHIITSSPLEEIQKEIKKHQDFIDQLYNQDLQSGLKISKLILLLRNKQLESDSFLPDKNMSTDLLRKVNENKNLLILHWYNMIHAQIHFYFYDFAKALEYIQEADKLTSSYSQLAIPEHYFYYSLIILENYEGLKSEKKKIYWDILKNNHQKLVDLENNCAINFKNKSLLISARMASISGNFIKAVDLFDRAIQSAKESEYIQNEALANELAAKYYYSREKTTIAAAYVREACHAYAKWGATAKIEQLENIYPTLLKKRRRFNDPNANEVERNHSANIFFSLASIVKASQTISKEIILERIVEELLKILLQNTHTERVYFLIEREQQFEIIAEGITNREIQTTSCIIPLEDFNQIAHSVIYYVIRTRKLIVLDDARKNGMFAYNNYIREKQPKSILCLPIISHKKLTGIVYLENNSVTSAFSPKQVEMLTLLISQVSISIENSMLYNSLANITEQLSASKSKLEKKIQILEQELENHFS